MTTEAVLEPEVVLLERSRVLAGRVPHRSLAARRTARLLIVDSDPIVRFGLRQLFAADPELAVIGEAASPRDALVIADRCPPDVVLLDVDLGRGDCAGIELARIVLERHRACACSW